MKLHFERSEALKVESYFEDCVNNDKEKFSHFFDGKDCEVFPVANENKLYVGLGKQSCFTTENMKNAGFSIGTFCQEKGVKELMLSDESFPELKKEENLLALLEGFYVSSYKFDYYKSTKKEFNLEKLFFDLSSETPDMLLEKIEELKSILESSFFTRDIVNLRANDIYPETLANLAKEELTKHGVTVKVYNKKEIEELGLTAFLDVSKGSDKEPRLIIMEYLNGGTEKPLALVGKGLTYDSGGYSIKPTDSMSKMHSDMGGAGTVIGTMAAIAKNKLKTNVVAVVAACENMISGSAYHPGDIIKTLNGKTIEIVNTDAEGRITLADAVYYTVKEFEPEMLVDVATLTGACVVALGSEYTGLITNNEEAANKVKKAANEANEKVWELPNDSKFKKLNESKSADIMNSGGRMAGTITAGLFIGEFVDDCPWVHLDIAGTAYQTNPGCCQIEGATGVHVKTLYYLAKNNQK